jgi:hypothetical protein
MARCGQSLLEEAPGRSKVSRLRELEIDRRHEARNLKWRCCRMPDNPMESKTIWLRTKDEEVLILLRELLEPLGYSVEFGPDAEDPIRRANDETCS